jgi:hypothetical protein
MEFRDEECRVERRHRDCAWILSDDASRSGIRRKELGSLQHVGPRAWIIHSCVADARIPRLLVSPYVESGTPGLGKSQNSPPDF